MTSRPCLPDRSQASVCEFLIIFIQVHAPSAPPPLWCNILETNHPSHMRTHTSPVMSVTTSSYRSAPHNPRPCPSRSGGSSSANHPFPDEGVSPKPRLRPALGRRDVAVPVPARAPRRRIRERREGSAGGGTSECPAAAGDDAATSAAAATTTRRLVERRPPSHRRRRRRHPHVPSRTDEDVVVVDRRRLQPQAATVRQLATVRALRLSQLRRASVGMSVSPPRPVRAGAAPCMSESAMRRRPRVDVVVSSTPERRWGRGVGGGVHAGIAPDGICRARRGTSGRGPRGASYLEGQGEEPREEESQVGRRRRRRRVRLR